MDDTVHHLYKKANMICPLVDIPKKFIYVTNTKHKFLEFIGLAMEVG